MKENGRQDDVMEKANFHGRKENIMMENGKKTSRYVFTFWFDHFSSQIRRIWLEK